MLHRDRKAYPEHQRACRVYSQFLAGFTEEEIASFFSIPVRAVELDLQHVAGLLPSRVLVAQWNDRARLLLQRSESERYRRLMGEALSVQATDYLKAGISPASALREFREATGLVSKPEPLLQINTQANIIGGNAGINAQGITSAEDLIRRVLDRMAQNGQAVLPVPTSSATEIEPFREPEGQPEPGEGGGSNPPEPSPDEDS